MNTTGQFALALRAYKGELEGARFEVLSKFHLLIAHSQTQPALPQLVAMAFEHDSECTVAGLIYWVHPQVLVRCGLEVLTPGVAIATETN